MEWEAKGQQGHGNALAPIKLRARFVAGRRLKRQLAVLVRENGLEWMALLIGDGKGKFLLLFKADVSGAEAATVGHTTGHALLPLLGLGAGGRRASFPIRMFVACQCVDDYHCLKITNPNGRVRERRTSPNSGGFSSIRMHRLAGNRQGNVCKSMVFVVCSWHNPAKPFASTRQN